MGHDHPHTRNPCTNWLCCTKKNGITIKPNRYLIQAIEGRRLKLGDTHPHTLESLNDLIALYEAWNKPEKAEEWRAKLQHTEAVDE